MNEFGATRAVDAYGFSITDSNGHDKLRYVDTPMQHKTASLKQHFNASGCDD